MKKIKILAAGLAALLCLAFIPALSACSQDSPYVQTVNDHVVYTLYDSENNPVEKEDYYDENGEPVEQDGLYYTVTGYSEPVGAATIVSEIDDIPVKAIGEQAFIQCTSITSLVIEEGVEAVGGAAFAYCTAMRQVTLPSTIEMGFSMFAMCLSLESVTISDEVELIADRAFYGCSVLSKINAGENSDINLPSSLKQIGFGAFRDCPALAGKIDIPDGVTEIEPYVFTACSGITGVTMGENVTQIGYAAFTGCTSLTDITLSPEIEVIDEGAFSYCTSLEEFTVPQAAVKIGANTFEGCTSLTEVNFLPFEDGTAKGCWLYTEELAEDDPETPDVDETEIPGSDAVRDKLSDFTYTDNFRTAGYLPPSEVARAANVAGYLTDDCVDCYWYLVRPQ